MRAAAHPSYTNAERDRVAYTRTFPRISIYMKGECERESNNGRSRSRSRHKAQIYHVQLRTFQVDLGMRCDACSCVLLIMLNALLTSPASRCNFNSDSESHRHDRREGRRRDVLLLLVFCNSPPALFSHAIRFR